MPTINPTFTKGFIDPNTGKYSGGNLVLDDIAEFFGLSRSSSLDQVCTAEEINKFSRHKPVEYGSSSNRHPQPLMGDEIKGNPQDVGNGIIYGVRVGASQTTWNELHDIDFDYVRRPSSCFRISDFDQYYHGATCPIRGECALPTSSGARIISEDTPQNNIFYITLRTEGNEYEMSVYDLYGFESEQQVRTLYPCVKIGNYVHCLKNSALIATGTTADYTQMYDTANSTWYNQFYVDVSDAPSGTFESGQQYQVTVFLTTGYTTSLNEDLRTEWVDVSGEERLQNDIAYVVPGLVGLDAFMYTSGGEVSTTYWGSYPYSCILNSLVDEDATITVSVRYLGYQGVTVPTERVNSTIIINSLTVESMGTTQTITFSGASQDVVYEYGPRPFYPQATFTLEVGLGVTSVLSADITVVEKHQSITRTLNITS